MPLNDKYSGYEDYIENTVEALNECSTIAHSLQRSTYNPEVVALTFSIQVLLDLLADASALALSNNANLREHEFKINEIVQYLN